MDEQFRLLANDEINKLTLRAQVAEAALEQERREHRMTSMQIEQAVAAREAAESRERSVQGSLAVANADKARYKEDVVDYRERLRDCVSELKRLKAEASKPKRRINAPNWAKVLGV